MLDLCTGHRRPPDRSARRDGRERRGVGHRPLGRDAGAGREQAGARGWPRARLSLRGRRAPAPGARPLRRRPRRLRHPQRRRSRGRALRELRRVLRPGRPPRRPRVLDAARPLRARSTGSTSAACCPRVGGLVSGDRRRLRLPAGVGRALPAPDALRRAHGGGRLRAVSLARRSPAASPTSIAARSAA